MPVSTEFVSYVIDAYEHVYDQVYLRACPLGDMLNGTPSASRKERAWWLHKTLIDVIEELNPGSRAPTFSREWRRYRLMLLRYEQGLDPQAVADQLTVSRRHYYRLQQMALEAIAEILWERYAEKANEPPTAEGGDAPPLRDLELIRLEVARVAHADRHSRIEQVIGAVCDLLRDHLTQHSVRVDTSGLHALSSVSVGESLLRQIVLSLMSYIAEYSNHTTIILRAREEDVTLELSVRIEPLGAFRPPIQSLIEERTRELEELAAVGGIDILSVHAGQSIAGFDLRIPTLQRTVMVVDDNEDVLRLFSSYLIPHGYRAMTVQTGKEALEIAQRSQLFAIVLDLMMPVQDGWDILQTLLNLPQTQHIPIVVCSVLGQQKDLALSLGATAFLEKPITQQRLLAALEALERT